MILGGVSRVSVRLLGIHSTFTRSRKGLLLAAGCLAGLSLCGCGPTRVRADFRGYETAYADTSNRELLLNLARLENRDPTYFFKLGQITSSYRMQASLTGTGNLAATTSGLQVPTGGGSPGGLYENDPVFQFIPVNDDTNAQLLLKPIAPETFYILYQQGWRVDQLFRLMVDRIEIARWDDAKKACRVQTIHNLPPPAPTSADGVQGTDYSNEAEELSSYVTFLRVSAAVWDLQRRGMLLLRLRSQFVPFGENAGFSQNAPQAKDQNDAVSKSQVWQKSATNEWILGQKEFVPEFHLSPQITVNGALVPDMNTISSQIATDLPELSKGMALQQALGILASGFSIEGGIDNKNPEEDLCPGNTTSSHLVLRSMIGLMTAAAQEQKPFLKLRETDPVVPPSYFDLSGSAAGGTFRQEVPAVEQLPLLQLTWDHRDDATSAKTEVSYRDQTYLVADPRRPVAPGDEYWNRDMFRLIGDLTSEVTVDISKFPLPEILQLHTD